MKRFILFTLPGILLFFGCSGAPLSIRAPFSLDTTLTLEIRNAGKEINTVDNEYGLFVKTDGKTLYYVTARQEDVTHYMVGSESVLVATVNHTVYTAEKGMPEDTVFGRPKELPYPINTDLSDGPFITSADESVAILVGCDRSEGMGGCDLYEIVDPNTNTTAISDISEVNSPYWDSAPTLSADGNTLYFVSDRPGTIGGYSDNDKDIFFCRRMEDGQGTKPENLGFPINSEFPEDSPFFSSGDSLLFFSSASPDGYGGFDLYVAQLQPDGSWGQPVNLGSPINTPGDERYIAVVGNSRLFYFASTRKDIKNYGKYDIFMARFVP